MEIDRHELTRQVELGRTDAVEISLGLGQLVELQFLDRGDSLEPSGFIIDSRDIGRELRIGGMSGKSQAGLEEPKCLILRRPGVWTVMLGDGCLEGEGFIDQAHRYLDRTALAARGCVSLWLVDCGFAVQAHAGHVSLR